MFHDATPRIGSPKVGCSTLTTSAPQSLRTAAAAGTKAYMATSTTLTPSSTFTSASPGHGSMVGGQFDEHFGELLFGRGPARRHVLRGHIGGLVVLEEP